MKKTDLEISILSCFILKPELIEQTKLEDKHFKQTQRMWQFMKSFYKKFKCFDLQLMNSVCKDKWKLRDYLLVIISAEVTTCNFKLYEQQLIDMYEQDEIERIIIDQIYTYATDLLMKNINLETFKNKVDKLYDRKNDKNTS